MIGIGETLRRIRLEHGLTLRQVAQSCGLSISFLSQAERGISSVSVSALERVCRVFGLSLREFFTVADPPSEAGTAENASPRKPQIG